MSFYKRNERWNIILKSFMMKGKLYKLNINLPLNITKTKNEYWISSLLDNHIEINKDISEGIKKYEKYIGKSYLQNYHDKTIERNKNYTYTWSKLLRLCLNAKEWKEGGIE